ncbi:MAG: hypothetical protein IKW99_03765 [Bacteroidales bacterium]|nr:hypothetical protein [Bacteroidales bacterium]
MMKQLIICVFLLCHLLPVGARDQMSVEQAWKWQNKIGEIRGFNQPEVAYPGMSRDQILRKASELGLNSVRSWIGGNTVEEQIAFISEYVDDASKYGLTFSPVLSFYGRYYNDNSIPEEERLKRTEEYIRKVVGAFAKDERIAMWDIWNEPSTAKNDETMRQMDWLERMVEWCRLENPVQPITSSIIWEGGEYDTTSTYYKRRMEIERMMDIHNIHNYRFLQPEHTPPIEIIKQMKRMDGRPIVSSEVLARPVSGGLTRTLKLFAREHVNFYLWGMFVTDSRNWSVQWGRTTYDPYEPIFHDMLYSDGTPYDYREIENLRKFRFESEEEQIYAPLSRTERWTAERAWKWVAGGPIKGVTDTLFRQEATKAGNSLRLKLDYADFVADEKAFMDNFEHQLDEAERVGMTVMPVLLFDQDILDAEGIEIPQVRFLRTYPNDFAENGDEYLITPFNNGEKRAAKQRDDNPYWGSDFAESLSISKSEAAAFAERTATKNILAYINVVLRRFYADSRIEGWDIYYHPGKNLHSEREASMWVSQLFDLVRFISPTQPTFMTPLVSVGDFTPDLRYKDELIHGRHGGWGRLSYSGCGSASLTYKIWILSDLTAFSSTMKAAETGWLMSIGYHFGRPLLCSYWSAPDADEALATLELFSRSHIFWYSGKSLSADAVGKFKFRHINTDRDSADLVP